MLGTLAAIIIVVVFFKSSLKADKNPVHYAAIGFLSFFIPALLWTYFIAPDIKDSLQHDPSNLGLRFMGKFAYVMISSITSTWVWFKIFRT